MVEKKASDLFITTNSPVRIKIEGKIMPVGKTEMTPELTEAAALTAS
jgi:twitching motility protein PilU